MPKPDGKVTTLDDQDSSAVTPASKATATQDLVGDSAGIADTPASHGLSGKKVKVKFFNSEEDTSPIKASLNGVAYQIPRGEVSEIPVELLEVFNNAQVMFTDGNGELAFKPRHSFQVIG